MEGLRKGCLALVIVTPSLALGAVHPPVLAFYLLLAALLFVLLLTRPNASAPPLDLVSILFLGLIAVTIIQLLPLPAFVVRLLAPAVYDIRSRAAAPLGPPVPSLMPLSLDVTLTMQELGKLFLYLAVYWTVLAWTRRHGHRFIINLVVVTGVAAAGILLAHQILVLDKVYGFYTPLYAGIGTDRASAPLMNPNHMAGLLGLCAAAAIGRALGTHEQIDRVLNLVLAAIIGGALMLTLSRGGIAAFISGQLLFALLMFLSRLGRRGKRFESHWSWLPIGLVFSMGLGFFAAQDAIVGEFLGGDVKKLELVLEGIPLIGRFWTTGTGRGAFWVGFPLVSDLTVTTTFTHAENAVIQLLADYGILVGGIALMLPCVVIVRLLKRNLPRPELVAAVSALVAFGIHNLVDFNMEIPGVAVIAVALVGVLNGGSVVGIRGAVKGRLVPRVARPIVVVASTGSIAMALAAILYFGPHGIDREARAYRSAWNGDVSEPFEPDRLRVVLNRHPADWYIPLLAGVRTYKNGRENPLPFLARAIELNPSSASAHYFVGATLLRSGHLEQALLELRIAAGFKSSLAGPAAGLLVARKASFEQLKGIAVTRQEKLLLWRALASAFEHQGDDAQSELADKAVLNVDSRQPISLARQARRLMARGEEETALALARRLREVPDFGPAGVQLEAEILEKSSRNRDALKVLNEGLREFPFHPGLLRRLAWSRQRADDHRGALEAARELKALSASSSARASAVLLEAGLSLAEGRKQVALAKFREAFALDPTNVSILERIVGLAEKEGEWRRALEALRQLARSRPDDAALQRRLEQLEQFYQKKKSVSER